MLPTSSELAGPIAEKLREKVELLSLKIPHFPSLFRLLSFPLSLPLPIHLVKIGTRDKSSQCHVSISHLTMGLHPYPYPTTLRFPFNGMMPSVTCEPHLSSMFDSPIAKHVAPLGPLIKCQVSRTPLRASKNVKFRLSRNSTTFDVVARFRETIPTVKSVSSSEI